jgi:hypothetical protein
MILLLLRRASEVTAVLDGLPVEGEKAILIVVWAYCLMPVENEIRNQLPFEFVMRRIQRGEREFTMVLTNGCRWQHVRM